MKLNIVDYKVKNYLTLIPLGDVHYGSRECNVDVFKAHIEMIKNTKDCAVILMGDLVNVGLRDSVGAGPYDDNKTPEEQYEEILKLLLPIKSKIISCLCGNHEERIRKTTSFDISKMLAKELKVPYLQYGGLHKIKVNGINYHVYSIHGSSGATTGAGKMNACRKMQEKADADIYLHGHLHSLDYSQQIYYSISNKNKTIEQRIKHFILTGGFVLWDGSYGEMKSYSLSPIGFPKVKLWGQLSRGSKKVEVKFTDR